MRSGVLLEMPDLALGEFECPPGDALWDEVNDIGARPHVVFPRTHVVIAQDGARPVLCTPNHMVFYRAHQHYRRDLCDERGDRCLWLAIAPELVEEAGGLPGAPAGPGDPLAFLMAVALARHLAEHPAPRSLVAEEAALRLVARALGGAREATAPSARRARTRADHAELVEAAKEMLAARTADPPSLVELAGALHVSPFHLARVFRAGTGYSPGSYVHGLRVRAAVEWLLRDPGVELSRLALDLGYCSASHFTDRFRATFGRPPSALRAAESSTIVEAARAAAA
jgi:AraC-like DNA-binding protein